MVTVQIDLPVFFSATEALGHASGSVSLEALPVAGSAFATPASWAAALPEYFGGHGATVWYVEPWDLPGPSHLVGLSGIVCPSLEAARTVANVLAAMPGIAFNAHVQQVQGGT